MTADPVVGMVFRRALLVVAGIACRTLVMLNVALPLGVEFRHDRTRIRGEGPRMQPDKQAAKNDPSDKGMSHLRCANVAAITQLSSLNFGLNCN